MKFALVNPALGFRGVNLLRLPGTALPAGVLFASDEIRGSLDMSLS